MAADGKTRCLVRVENPDGEGGSQPSNQGVVCRKAGSTQPQSAAEVEQQQLDEYVDDGRCSAISVSTDERCEKDALAGSAYCGTHYHLRSE
jgi:hypothetical protein